jgi:hypothetical protein
MYAVQFRNDLGNRMDYLLFIIYVFILQEWDWGQASLVLGKRSTIWVFKKNLRIKKGVTNTDRPPAETFISVNSHSKGCLLFCLKLLKP